MMSFSNLIGTRYAYIANITGFPYLMRHVAHGEFYLENVAFNEPWIKSLISVSSESVTSLF